MSRQESKGLTWGELAARETAPAPSQDEIDEMWEIAKARDEGETKAALARVAAGATVAAAYATSRRAMHREAAAHRAAYEENGNLHSKAVSNTIDEAMTSARYARELGIDLSLLAENKVEEANDAIAEANFAEDIAVNHAEELAERREAARQWREAMARTEASEAVE